MKNTSISTSPMMRGLSQPRWMIFKTCTKKSPSSSIQSIGLRRSIRACSLMITSWVVHTIQILIHLQINSRFLQVSPYLRLLGRTPKMPSFQQRIVRSMTFIIQLPSRQDWKRVRILWKTRLMMAWTRQMATGIYLCLPALTTERKIS